MRLRLRVLMRVRLRVRACATLRRLKLLWPRGWGMGVQDGPHRSVLVVRVFWWPFVCMQHIQVMLVVLARWEEGGGDEVKNLRRIVYGICAVFAPAAW